MLVVGTARVAEMLKIQVYGHKTFVSVVFGKYSFGVRSDTLGEKRFWFMNVPADGWIPGAGAPPTTATSNRSMFLRRSENGDFVGAASGVYLKGSNHKNTDTQRPSVSVNRGLPPGWRIEPRRRASGP